LDRRRRVVVEGVRLHAALPRDRDEEEEQHDLWGLSIYNGAIIMARTSASGSRQLMASAGVSSSVALVATYLGVGESVRKS
jgi:hypothetical protein